ncbi:M56 family metallopeptidase [Bradyrhizobium sp. ARR65]|uniref:M56 family metallopeptidase n=1 Tax=Bradyrhizobium sp. ARR65 TaxID=1040989 RepID=UPI000464BEDE|nr:M56 family metallopeptidase [Bradyrhizobium sp. ARR65]
MILGEVAELALRAAGLGCIVWLGLKVARVRNPSLRMTVWTAVLCAALAMPALTPLMRLPLPADLIRARAQPVLSILSTQDDILPLAPSAEPPPIGEARSASTAPRAATAQSVNWIWWATAAYLVVAGAMIMRLFIGIAVMCRITAAARPLRDGAFGHANVRLTDVVRVPVTFASVILLPADSIAWSDRKRHVVLLHEGAHIAHGDFYRLLLASLYRAAFWFSPFAWWLHRHLAELAEMVSDDAVVAGTGDSRFYVDVLLQMADAAAAIPPAGLAMARSSSLPRRVERLFATAPPQASGRRKRVLVAAAVLPLAVLSAGSVTREPNLPPAPIAAGQPADLAPHVLDRFIGDYQIGVGSLLKVVRDGGGLSAHLIGAAPMRLRTRGDRAFISEAGDAKFTFVADAEGQISGLELYDAQGKLARGTRIDPSLAQLIETRFAQRVAAAPDRFVQQLPAPGGDDRLRRAIEDLKRGAPDYARMSPQLANQMRRRVSILHEALSELGAVRSVSFRGVGPGGYDIYAVEFANGSAEFRIDLGADGTIDDLTFRPEGDGRPGAVLACAVEPTLKSSSDAAPIRVSLINRSGANVRLFRLGPSGRWVTNGALENDVSTDILTDVAGALMVADAEGACREIILPGRLTRVHLISPGGAENSAQIYRDLPAKGGYEALQAYIAGVRSREVSQDLLTREAASAIRSLLKQRQAILAKLGPQLTMSFRGVGGDGSDIYRTQFVHGTADWQIALTKDGRISSVSLLP